MIEVEGVYFPELHKNVEKYCKENDIILRNVIDRGYEYSYMAIMEGSKLNPFLKYLDELKDKRKKFRKSKSFLWRIFH